MRGLHVLCDWSAGGAERIVLELAGPEDAVVAVHDTGPFRDSFSNRGVRTLCAGRQRGRPGLRAWHRLQGWVRQADFVHTHLWDGHVFGGLAALRAARPWLATVHNPDPDLSWPRRLLRDRLLRKARVVAVSDAVRADLSASGVCARVIHNGIDVARFGPHRGGDGILGIGRLVWQKGFDVLLRALPDRPVRIVGDGPEASALQRLSPQACFMGRVTDVAPYLQRADVLVIPSRWEGYGLVAAEAMAAGVPVVASRVGALVEVLGDAAVWVPPESPAELRTAVLDLLCDPQRASQIARLGLERVQRWSVEAMLLRYKSIRDEVLSCSASPQSRGIG